MAPLSTLDLRHLVAKKNIIKTRLFLFCTVDVSS